MKIFYSLFSPLRKVLYYMLYNTVFFRHVRLQRNI